MANTYYYSVYTGEEIDSNITSSIAHRENQSIHITPEERKAWNNAKGFTSFAEGGSLTLVDAGERCGLYSLIVEGNSSQNGTPTSTAPIEIDSIGNSGSLDITAMTGNQLANLPDIETNNNGITWTCANGIVTAKGTSTIISSSSTFLAHYMPTGTVGTFCVSGGNNKVAVFVYIKYANGTSNYVYNNSFVLDGTEQTVRLYLQVEAGVTVDDTIYPMLNKGSTPMPFESYKGNTATITSALPLCSVGDVKDELIFNADGTAKVIKKIRLLDMTNVTFWTPKYIEDSDYQQFNVGMTVLSKTSNIVCSHFPYNANCTNGKELGVYIAYNSQMVFGVPKSTLIEYGYIGGTDSTYLTALKAWLKSESEAGNSVKIMYQLATPQEINLTADETAALFSLETFEGLTNVFNSDNAQMSVKYWVNGDVGSLLTEISRNTNARLTALENAIINA